VLIRVQLPQAAFWEIIHVKSPYAFFGPTCLLRVSAAGQSIANAPEKKSTTSTTQF
jgi:hypothetical protein